MQRKHTICCKELVQEAESHLAGEADNLGLAEQAGEHNEG